MGIPTGTYVAEAERAAEIRRYLQDLLGKPPFSSSRRRGDLLRYLVEKTLDGRAGELTEYALGVDVFGKPASFDPQTESTVRAEMSRLRRALQEHYGGSGAADAWRIEFPSGYVPAIAPCGINTVQAESAPALASGSAIGRAKRLRPGFHWMWVAAVAGVLIGVAMSRSSLWRPAPIDSVVVLPFENLTGNPNLEYLADGITEQLTDSLAHIRSIRVVARTSAFQFKGKALDVREIGRRVNATAVVEGSLRTTAGRLQLTVQVNRAADGYHVLSQTFAGSMEDLPRLETAIVAPVRAVLGRGEEAPSKGRAPNPQAYDLFLKARAYRGDGTLKGFEPAVALLNQAVDIDPGFADAYASLAGVYTSAAVNFAGDPTPYLEQAKASAAKALEIDPHSARAIASQGFVDSELFRWADSERELRESIRLMPHTVAHDWLGLVLMEQGRFDEALAEFKITEQQDPLSTAPGAGVGFCLLMARRYDDALAKFLTLQRLHPEAKLLHLYTGFAWDLIGNYDRAMAEYRMLPDDTAAARVALAHLLAVSGRKEEARSRLAGMEHPAPGADPPRAFDVAAVYAALGDRDRAFLWLNRALDTRSIGLLKVHPALDPLRSDARYADLLRKTGLAQ